MVAKSQPTQTMDPKPWVQENHGSRFGADLAAGTNRGTMGPQNHGSTYFFQKKPWVHGPMVTMETMGLDLHWFGPCYDHLS